jgi:hypothetical protein
MRKKMTSQKPKIQILSLALSNEELDELRIVLEFAGMIALDLASSQASTAPENQMRALKRIASSSTSLLAAVSESMKDALAHGDVAETTLH